MRYLAVTGLVLLAAAALIWMVVDPGSSDLRAQAPDPPDLAQGKALYGTYCASCHGANLEGQANWQAPGSDGRLPAPPHDESGHTWHHGDQLLFDYTKLGGTALMAQRGVDFDSGMPGFADQLTDAEIWNVLAYIKSTWPERIRSMQAERTAVETQ